MRSVGTILGEKINTIQMHSVMTINEKNPQNNTLSKCIV